MGPQSMALDCNQLLGLTADMGCRLMASGAEIYRVEESMQRLLKAYGMEGAEVFAIPSCIIVSATAPGGEAITRMQRIGAHGTDLELLELCDALRAVPQEAIYPGRGYPKNVATDRTLSKKGVEAV